MHSHTVDSERSRSAVLDRPSTADALIPHLLCNWPRVVFNSIDVGRPTGRRGRLVTARIHLGALFPTDVRVLVVAGTAEYRTTGEIELSCRGAAEEDGTYRFEAMVAPAVLATGSCAVRVTPASVPPAWQYILETIEAPCKP